jgi:hypothetical protein
MEGAQRSVLSSNSQSSEDSSGHSKPCYHLRSRKGVKEVEDARVKGGISSDVVREGSLNALGSKSHLSHAQDKVLREDPVWETRNHSRGS